MRPEAISPDSKYVINGRIYTDLDQCLADHPGEDIAFGYCLDGVPDTVADLPDWFDTMEEVTAFAKALPAKESKIEDQEEKDKGFECLKRELFIQGNNAIEDFVGYEIDPTEDKDILENRLDEAYQQMPDDIFEKYLKKYGVQQYTVSFAVDARYYADVYATSVEDAKDKGDSAFFDCEIGDLECVDASIDHVEDENGKYY